MTRFEVDCAQKTISKMIRKNGNAEHVVCVKNEGYRASLVVRRIYKVLPDPEAGKRGLVRVIDESGEDYLYPKKLFAAPNIPRALILFWAHAARIRRAARSF
jgi:hypothetical protein